MALANGLQPLRQRIARAFAGAEPGLVLQRQGLLTVAEILFGPPRHAGHQRRAGPTVEAHSTPGQGGPVGGQLPLEQIPLLAGLLLGLAPHHLTLQRGLLLLRPYGRVLLLALRHLRGHRRRGRQDIPKHIPSPRFSSLFVLLAIAPRGIKTKV
ncbi:hypothetical protein MTBLM5_130070 [Magnetospirillum sp. LM-5]|nr:hypothetical protein MTBLM5_130070 [Magnetospirillum sp. LM-5]